MMVNVYNLHFYRLPHPNLLRLLFQLLYLPLDHGGNLARGGDEEPVHVKHSHLVTLTGAKLEQNDF